MQTAEDSEGKEIEAARAEFESLGERRVREKVARSRHTIGLWNNIKIELAEQWLQEQEDARIQAEKERLQAERHRDRRATYISTGAACLSALAAVATVLYMAATLNEEIESKRPYFTVQADMPGNDIYIRFENVGARPAKDMSIKIAFVGKDFSGDPKVHNYTLGNELPAGIGQDISVSRHWGTELYSGH